MVVADHAESFHWIEIPWVAELPTATHVLALGQDAQASDAPRPPAVRTLPIGSGLKKDGFHHAASARLFVDVDPYGT